MPTAAYGGPKIDEETLTVTSATLSADGKKVTLVDQRPARPAGSCTSARRGRSPPATASRCGAPRPGTPSTPSPARPPATNLALNKPATADSSCNANEGPAKAVNGTRHRRQHRQVVLAGRDQVAAGRPRRQPDVNRFVVKHAGAGGENTAWNTRDFTIQVSTNGTTWTTVGDGHRATRPAPPPTTSPRCTARYVRLNVTTPTSTGNTAARIYEFEVYGGRPRRRRATWRWASRPRPTAPALQRREDPAKAVNGSVTGGNTDKWCSLRRHQVAAGRPRHQPDGEPVRRQARRRRRREHRLEHPRLQPSRSAPTAPPGRRSRPSPRNTASITTHNITAVSGALRPAQRHHPGQRRQRGGPDLRVRGLRHQRQPGPDHAVRRHQHEQLRGSRRRRRSPGRWATAASRSSAATSEPSSGLRRLQAAHPSTSPRPQFSIARPAMLARRGRLDRWWPARTIPAAPIWGRP